MIVHEDAVRKDGPVFVAEVLGVGVVEAQDAAELLQGVDDLVTAVTGADAATFVVDLRKD